MNVRGVLRGRARALRNSLIGRGRTRAGRGPRGPLVSLALTAAAAAIAHSGFAALFGALERAGATPAELRAALSLALDIALAGLLLFDLESAVSTLILDRDLDLLRRAPLSPAAILALKLLDALPRTATPLLVVALPALLAFAGTRPVSAEAWLAVPFVLGLLWAIPLGAGTALTLALLSRVPARRARESLGLISTFTLAVLWLANLFVLPGLASAEGEPLARVRAMLSVALPALEWTPGGWATALFDGVPASDLARSALLLIVAAGASVVLAGLAAGRHLAPVLAAARTPVARPRGRFGRRRASFRRVPLVLAVMRRDRLLFVRDWTVLGDVLTAALLWMLLPLVALPLRPLHSPGLVRAMLLTLSVGMGYEIAARSFPLERRGAMWMRLAPVPPRRWAAAKLVSAGSFALALVAIAGAALVWAARLGPGEWLAVMVAVLPALTLSIALGLWTGAAFGDPDWTHARAVLTLGGRLVAAGLVVVQVAAWLTLTALEEGFSPGGSARLVSWMPGLIALGLGALAAEDVARRVGRPDYYR